MVVCDTTGINYLVQIGYISLIPRIFGKTVIPDRVASELRSPYAPAAVLDWALNLPGWVSVEASPDVAPFQHFGLHSGETAALALALQHRAEFFCTDDRRARTVAGSLGFNTVTTILVLDEAASRGWLDFNLVMNLLLQTNFRINPHLLTPLREKHRRS